MDEIRAHSAFSTFSPPKQSYLVQPVQEEKPTQGDRRLSVHMPIGSDNNDEAANRKSKLLVVQPPKGLSTHQKRRK